MYKRPRGAAAAILLAAATLLAAAGCSNTAGSTAKAGQGKTIKVGAIMYARDLEYWQLIEAGMKAAAKEAGVPLQVTVSNRDLATEASLVDNLHARGDNVLVISPLDKQASKAALDKAKSYGMTVVQYNTRVDDPSLKYFVGVDNAQLGKASGDAAVAYIKSKLGGHAKVALITGGTTTTGPVRLKGFTDALAALPGAKVVTQAEAGTPDAGAQALNTVLQGHPDINLVWCWNGGALSGALAAAGQAHKAFKIVGVDMSQQVADAMTSASSPVLAVADQHAFDVGNEAVANAVKLARGQNIATESDVTPVVIHAGNAQELDGFRQELAKAKG